MVLIGALSLSAATGAGWRVALLASFAGPAARLWSRPRRGDRDAAAGAAPRGRLPGGFWVAAAMLFCTTAAEWCITAWGASFVEEAADVSADTAVALMVGYFGGVVAGRVAGSRLARRHARTALLAIALVVTAVGLRDPVARRDALPGAARARGARPRARQPVPARRSP